MNAKWKKADAKAAIDAIALEIAAAFNVHAPACFVPDYLDTWEWRIDRVAVWTKAGAAEMSIEIDADFAHMYFRFDDPARAKAVAHGYDRLNPHSGKWNSLIGAPDSLSGWIASLKADFAAVAEPNPPADELAAWEAEQARQAAYWEQARKEFAADLAARDAA